jgi:hypothetical protein
MSVVRRGVVTTPPWVVTTSLVVTTPVRRGCNLSVWWEGVRAHLRAFVQKRGLAAG